MSEFTDALSDGVASLASLQSATATFGTATFAGALGALRQTDPRMAGSSQRLFDFVVTTTNLPTPYPRRGDVITINGQAFTITTAYPDATTGQTVFTLALN